MPVSVVRVSRLACLLLCACSLMLAGCASKYGARQTNVHYYPACYQPIEDLRKAESSYNSTIGIGALTGALFGAAIGAAQTGSVEGALAGAVIGTGAGAVGGYALAEYNDTKESRAKLAQYSRELGVEQRSLDRVTAAGRMAYTCYTGQFKAALADYKAKRISRQELDARYAEIKSGLAEASKILGTTIEEANKREGEYQKLLAQVDAQRVSANSPGPKKTRSERKAAQKAAPPRNTETQGLATSVANYQNSTRNALQVHHDMDQVQLQMEKVMLAQG